MEGKLVNKPCWQLAGSNPALMPVTSYTIGMDTPEVFLKKVKEAEGFKVIKVKLGRDTDKELINIIRSVTQVPIYVDANRVGRIVIKAGDVPLATGAGRGFNRATHA
ncbi:enolase-like domain-containing protein [Mucilaginibacter humi]|uniref:hypothetical protein n=1 Tax=Mucilaginibacter humi TaxID=2732510 RepID=UPI001FE3B9A6|nr:hypothetical protein [Mucilaginibacter humi]